MQALLILLICLVTMAILAGRYGVDSRGRIGLVPARPGQEPRPPLASRHRTITVLTSAPGRRDRCRHHGLIPRTGAPEAMARAGPG